MPSAAPASPPTSVRSPAPSPSPAPPSTRASPSPSAPPPGPGPAQRLRSWASSDALPDLRASLVVFLVALPLSAGVAVASGVPVELGFVTAIVGGILVGLLPGSSLQVSGPAAGLTVLVAEIVADQGLAALGVIVLLAGLVQVGLGLARLGRWFRAVSTSVVQGMLAGIGLTLVLGQVHALTDRTPPGNPVANLLGLPATVAAVATQPRALTAFGVGALTLAVLVAWKHAPRALRVVPAPLVAVLAAIAVTAGFGLDVDRVEVERLLDAVSPIVPSTFAGLAWAGVITSALTVALIASAESMFSAAAVDRMHSGKRTSYDTELVAQGVGNSVCGLLGALPMTAVIVRSATNVSAGARTRASGVLHGVWILVFAVAVPAALGLVPMAALAAVLVQAGWKLVAGVHLRQLWQTSRSEVAITVVTIVAVLALNLLEGVAIGLVLAVVKAAVQSSRTETRLHEGPETVDLHIGGTTTFVRLPQFADTLEAVPADKAVRVHLEDPERVDRACREALDGWTEQRQACGQDVQVLTGGSR